MIEYCIPSSVQKSNDRPMSQLTCTPLPELYAIPLAYPNTIGKKQLNKL